MTQDRRHSDIKDRRTLPELDHDKNAPQASETDKDACIVTFMTTKGDTILRREISTQLSEEPTPVKQEIARLRGNSLSEIKEEIHPGEIGECGQEEKSLLPGGSIVSGEQIVLDENKDQIEQLDQNVKLRLVNEQLVIASIRLQVAHEEVEKSKAEMTRLAHFDFLTDLPNRAQLYDRIGQAIAMAKRHPAKLAILLLDLDRFKVINDTLGHSIGDNLLQSVAQRLKSTVRNTDTVSRLGGDEFVLLLSEVGQDDSLALKLSKIHDIVTAPYRVAGHDLHVGASIGVSIFPDNGDDSATLIRNADTAMYYAKKIGRNKVQFFLPEMGARDAARQDVEIGLHQALKKGEFVLHYQAQFDLENWKISGVEALIRWNHPIKGLISPAGFISIAEECGVIVQMGRWVLREACRQAKSWLEAGLPFNVIAVNISALEFESKEFLQNVQSALRETGLAPNRLELELTETALMKNIDIAAVTLHKLRSMGVSISIDDFGTGYSSLSYLKKFPIDTMKIDQSFVRDISKKDDDILLNAVIGIGKSLRHRVIAEGVENSTQLDFLRENECTAVQGFYMNIPMAAAEFSEFLKESPFTHPI